MLTCPDLTPAKNAHRLKTSHEWVHGPPGSPIC